MKHPCQKGASNASTLLPSLLIGMLLCTSLTGQNPASPPNIHVLSSGDIGINTSSMVGLADLTIRSTNSTWGGMYIESLDEANGKPFYGYAIDGNPKAFHYYDQDRQSLIFSVNGDKLRLTSDGMFGMGDLPGLSTNFYINKSDHPISASITSNYAGSEVKFGLHVFEDGLGTGDRCGVCVQTKGVPSLSKFNVAVQGVASRNGTTGPSFGVYGSVVGAGSGPGYGVYGLAANGGDAIYGVAFDGTSRAGFFEGNVSIGDDVAPLELITLKPRGFSDGALIELYDNDGTKTIELRGNGDNNTQGADLLMYNDAGGLAVQIDADVAGSGSGTIEIHATNGTRTVELDGSETAGQGAALKLSNAAGDVTIELDADFSGDGRVITDELEIKGGSDLAEYFDIYKTADAPEPGMVVCLDPDHPGQLRICSETKDRKVAGVVSGANGIKPGMMMGQEGSLAFGRYPVAIAGRVYVKVDESNGKIRPGDFMTTATTPGFAMRVRRFRKARGAILGKALTPADTNGFVLIMLQWQ